MRRKRLALAFLLVASLMSSQSRAQDAPAIGVTGAAGFPAFKGGVRISTPLGPTASLDLELARIGPMREPALGPAVTADVRWMRRGRRPSGDSRYWIFGAMFVDAKWSTPIIYPGHVVGSLEERRTLAVPRIGYGWDHVSRRGPRAGFEVSTGASGEEEGFVFATVFVMWGPPRK
jgi:hypothetical protein